MDLSGIEGIEREQLSGHRERPENNSWLSDPLNRLDLFVQGGDLEVHFVVLDSELSPALGDGLFGKKKEISQDLRHEKSESGIFVLTGMVVYVESLDTSSAPFTSFRHFQFVPVCLTVLFPFCTSTPCLTKVFSLVLFCCFFFPVS